MKYIYIIITLLFLTSCNNNRELFSKKIINEYSKGDFKIPSVYGYLDMFVLVENEEIAYTNINQLHAIYNKKYSKSFTKFEYFLYDALNQKIIFSRDEIVKKNGSVFLLNKQVKRNYEKSGISYLLNRYCENSKGNFSIKNQYVNKDMLFTILYYFFINDYEVTKDDYIGKYYLSKHDENLRN